MNQIVLHNYSAWSMAAVLHEMSKSLTDKLEQSPPAGVERSPISQNHGNFCKGKSVTTVAMRPELFVSISFLAKEEESLFTYDEEEEHLRIRYPGPYDPPFILGLVAAMFSQHAEVLSNALKSPYPREFALTPAYGLYHAKLKVNPQFSQTLITLAPGMVCWSHSKDVLVETTGGVTCTPDAPLKVKTGPLLAVGDLVMGPMDRENRPRCTVFCAQVQAIVIKISGDYGYVCYEFDLNAWAADSTRRGEMAECDVMVQYDKEKLRIIYDKLWMLDNYAKSLFTDYPSTQHRPFNAPSFELEMLMPVKKNFLKPDGSEDDSYIAATDLQEKGGIVNTKEDSDEHNGNGNGLTSNDMALLLQISKGTSTSKTLLQETHGNLEPLLRLIKKGYVEMSGATLRLSPVIAAAVTGFEELQKKGKTT